MLLAADGHEVTVLERDPAPPPADAESAWASWERRGVGQFRQAYGVQPALTRLLSVELPDVKARLTQLGALHLDFLSQLDPGLPGRANALNRDDQVAITARRPVMEAAFASVAEESAGVTVQRGVAVRSYCTGTEVLPGVPHITGVVTDSGRRISADVVIDATGRHSAINDRIVEIGGRTPLDSRGDNSTIYYTRYYRSRTGSLPEYAGGELFKSGHSIGLFLIPADNATWCLALWGLAEDHALRRLRRTDIFDSVVRRFPDREAWMDGEALTDVVPCVSEGDLNRSFVIDGEPVATGLLPAGDSASFTEPRLGRGTFFSVMQAVVVRDALKENTDGNAGELILGWDALFRQRVEPWLKASNTLGRAYGRETRTYMNGDDPVVDPSNRAAVLSRAFMNAARRDTEVGTWLLDLAGCAYLPGDLMRRPGVIDRILNLGDHDDGPGPEGPTRAELLTLLAGA